MVSDFQDLLITDFQAHSLRARDGTANEYTRTTWNDTHGGCVIVLDTSIQHCSIYIDAFDGGHGALDLDGTVELWFGSGLEKREK